MIASLFSIHAVRGYIALNITKAAAPAIQSADLYASLKLDLQQAQQHLGQLQDSYKTVARKERRLLDERITTARQAVQEARTRLAQADMPVHVSPLVGLEWFLAIILWFFNATCWSAWFGYASPSTPREQDTVAGWLAGYECSQPQHCSAIFSAYCRLVPATRSHAACAVQFLCPPDRAGRTQVSRRTQRADHVCAAGARVMIKSCAAVSALPSRQHGRLTS